MRTPAAACLALASIFVAPATGADAPPCRYVVPNDGTVIDTKTGLMWQQTLAMPVGALDWPTAMQYCPAQRFGGRDHWRLPTIKELLTLVDTSVAATPQTFAIDARFFPTPAKVLWSSTLQTGTSPVMAWGLQNDGSPYFFGMSMFGYGVRCVH
jgi:hypothetical protein